MLVRTKYGLLDVSGRSLQGIGLSPDVRIPVRPIKPELYSPERCVSGARAAIRTLENNTAEESQKESAGKLLVAWFNNCEPSSMRYYASRVLDLDHAEPGASVGPNPLGTKELQDAAKNVLAKLPKSGGNEIIEWLKKNWLYAAAAAVAVMVFKGRR
jgi:hypothetical protein